jgi:hypothetical protein
LQRAEADLAVGVFVANNFHGEGGDGKKRSR